jgi:hypothetical protein
VTIPIKVSPCVRCSMPVIGGAADGTACCPACRAVDRPLSIGRILLIWFIIAQFVAALVLAAMVLAQRGCQ